MSAPISMDKQYRTRDGRKVRVLCVDVANNDGDVVAALITNTNGHEWVAGFSADGHYYGSNASSEYDLIEVKPRRVEYIARYPGRESYAYKTPGEAQRNADSNRIACIRVEYEEGQFDDEVQS